MTGTPQQQTTRSHHRMPSFPAFEASGRYDEALSAPQGRGRNANDPFAQAAHEALASHRQPATLEEKTDAVVSCACAQNPLREVLY